MSLLLRLVSFLVVSLLLLYGWYWPALVVIAMVVLYAHAYEYWFFAFAVDVYFSPEPIQFWYTLVIGGITLTMLFIRPYVRVERDELS